uniref:E3 ubiquitin-protein ligase E3D n=1 Tax=Strongyloides venezuelensis TaxID=75913 RepID=A0A0K0FZM4_STRVS
MSKSCFKTWKDSKSGVSFRCPKCSKIILKNDCHLVYDRSDDILEGTNKAETSEIPVCKYNVQFDFMDNNFLVYGTINKRTNYEVWSLILVGFVLPTSTEGNFIEKIDCRDDITRHAVNFNKSLCTAIDFKNSEMILLNIWLDFKSLV